jgi:hypothetical protein
MKITMYKHDMTRLVEESAVPTLKAAGWSTTGNTSTIDSGAVVVRAPKKKKVETPAEEAKDAVEDLGNAINIGE